MPELISPQSAQKVEEKYSELFLASVRFQARFCGTSAIL